MQSLKEIRDIVQNGLEDLRETASYICRFATLRVIVAFSVVPLTSFWIMHEAEPKIITDAMHQCQNQNGES